MLWVLPNDQFHPRIAVSNWFHKLAGVAKSPHETIQVFLEQKQSVDISLSPMNNMQIPKSSPHLLQNPLFAHT
jgi:hypothetical protein